MNKINLHSRQKKILSILNAKHGIATGKEISSKIGVSERTVRSDISDINNCLKEYEIQIIPVHGKGYSLSIENRAVFLELFSEKESYITKEDRLKTLLLRLLREDDWCDIGNLEDEMFVSHTTIEKDIKGIKRRVSMQHPFLCVERKGSLIRLENDERKKRDIFTRFYVDDWDYDSREGIVLGHETVGDENLSAIQNALKKQLRKSGAFVDDYAFIYLTLAIYVLYSRVSTGHFVAGGEDDELIDEDIKYVLDELNETWKLDILKEEYVYLSRIKEQLVFLSEQTYSKNYVLSKTDLSCHHIVDDILNELFVEYGVDFTTDDKLFVDLDRHVQAIKNGIVATSIQNHVLGDELRKRYPFLGDMAHTISKKLGEKCGMEFGVEEEDYLLPFIVLAEESLYKKRRGKGIPTAVISHYNESITHYLMEILKRHYGDVLDLRGPYPVHAKELINLDETMLILTTVQMQAFDKLFKVPVLTVSPLVEASDHIGIDLYLTSLKSTYLYEVPRYQMEHYFPRELRYEMGDKPNFILAMAAVFERIRAHTGVEQIREINFEEDYYCLLSGGFFFCYQINDQIDETVVSLVDLTKDTSCKYVRNIKTVMYMVMPRSEKKTLGWFYYIAMSLSSHPDELRDVFNGKSLEELSINISK